MVARPPSHGRAGWLRAPKGKKSKWPRATGGSGARVAGPMHLPGAPAETSQRRNEAAGFFFFFFFFFFFLFFFFPKGFSEIKFYLLSAQAGAETQRPLPLGPNECGVPTIAKEPTMPRRQLLGVIPHRETAGWRRGRPGRCRRVGAPSRRQVTPATPKPLTARPPLGDDEPWGQGEGGSGAAPFERQPKATPPASWHSIFFLRERNPKALTLLQLPKPPIIYSKGALPHDCPPSEGPGGRRTEVDFLEGHMAGATRGPPRLPGAASPQDSLLPRK